jgi:hypothetical protein
MYCKTFLTEPYLHAHLRRCHPDKVTDDFVTLTKKNFEVGALGFTAVPRALKPKRPVHSVILNSDNPKYPQCKFCERLIYGSTIEHVFG